MFYRTTLHQGVHTNNYVESWHNILKSKFIPGPERRRIDVVIQIFKSEVLPRFQKDNYCVEMGFRKQRTNKFQLHAKALGESYTWLFLAEIGVDIAEHPTYFQIGSFTRPNSQSYIVAYDQSGLGAKKGRLTSCTCPHFARYGSACKHMYFLAKDQSVLVVERVVALVQEEYPLDQLGVEIRPVLPILIDSDIEAPHNDSDVEVLNPMTSRQTCYQPDNSYTMAPHSNIRVPVVFPLVLLGTHNSTMPAHEVEQIVRLDNYLATSALEHANRIMTTKKNRCTMLDNASIKEISVFRVTCEEVLNMVESRC
ncbi:hypothetical protein PTTG_29812 [Puccinia triticina 1-1 BBBD Race 1]|uniref:SWIM-type domain-containing protein n=1 Tax=Puccinia triticina (isolate 1-1 / race 1 (BBBD)) TaxID=630390 RepID=A0A180G1M9_PUCT1|nr:hypothetical protein PTTG_29812 [Puccinia triticina 1-1 BBBD Race 1]